MLCTSFSLSNFYSYYLFCFVSCFFFLQRRWRRRRRGWRCPPQGTGMVPSDLISTHLISFVTYMPRFTSPPLPHFTSFHLTNSSPHLSFFISVSLFRNYRIILMTMRCDRPAADLRPWVPHRKWRDMKGRNGRGLGRTFYYCNLPQRSARREGINEEGREEEEGRMEEGREEKQSYAETISFRSACLNPSHLISFHRYYPVSDSESWMYLTSVQDYTRCCWFTPHARTFHPWLGQLDPTQSTKKYRKLDVYIYLTKHAQTRKKLGNFDIWTRLLREFHRGRGGKGRGGEGRKGEERASYHIISQPRILTGFAL